LISVLNKLNRAIINQQEVFVLGRILSELDWYTRSHFKAEEVLMKNHAYPGLAEHIVEHERFKEQVGQYASHFRSGRVSIAVEVSDALQEWLLKHILQSDADFASYFQANGADADVNGGADMEIPESAPYQQEDFWAKEIWTY
jgi:hemerythrin-like metal-binding protein